MILFPCDKSFVGRAITAHRVTVHFLCPQNVSGNYSKDLIRKKLFLPFMAAVDTTSRPPITAPLAGNEEKAKLQEAENAKNQELDNLVKQEASNEKVYKALENFLLADPGRQLSQLGGSKGLLADADAAKSRGDNEAARGKYETAAKIEIYKQDKESARRDIDLAEKFTAPDDSQHREIHKTLLSHMDEVMRISSDYYANLSRSSESSQP